MASYNSNLLNKVEVFVFIGDLRLLGVRASRAPETIMNHSTLRTIVSLFCSLFYQQEGHNQLQKHTSIASPNKTLEGWKSYIGVMSTL